MYATAQSARTNANAKKGMDWAISSRAFKELEEGSTTRPRSPERTVKAQERTTPTGEDIVCSMLKGIEVGHKQANGNNRIIYDISPMDTIFMTGAGRGTAKSTTHEWLTDQLATAAVNLAIEGDDFSANVRTQPSRLKNYTNISRKDVQVTGTSRAVDNAGMADILSRHTARMSKEIKRDMEFMMLGNNPASAGASTVPRASGGVPNWIYHGQHYKNSAQTLQTTTAPVSGFATATGGSWANSATAYAEADLKDMLKLAWSTGGEVDTVLCDSIAFNRFSTFTGVATRFRDVGSKQPAQIIGYADVYVSPYGQHKLTLSRYMPANSAYGLQMDMWEVAYLRNFAIQDIAKVGDGDRKSLLAEWTLVAKNPLANCKAQGVA